MPLPVLPPSGGIPDKPGANQNRTSGIPTRPVLSDSTESAPTTTPSKPAGLPSRPTLGGLPPRPATSNDTPKDTPPSSLPSLPARPATAYKATPSLPAAPQALPVIQEEVAPEYPSETPKPNFDEVESTPAVSPVNTTRVSQPSAAVTASPSKKSKKKSFRETANHDPKAGKKNKGSSNVIRYVTLTGLLLVCGLGIKSAVFPPQPPSLDEIVATIQSDLGTSGFPRETAEGFVLSFAKTYFSSVSLTGEEFAVALADFVDPSYIKNIASATPTETLKVIDGPYVSGVREIDGNTAVFTLKILLSNKQWNYVEIPVQWNNDGIVDASGYGPALTIAGVPTIVPAPAIAEIAPDETEIILDEEATAAFTEVAPLFFRAWGSTDTEGLAAFSVTEGSSRIATGLQGSAIFSSVDYLEVSDTIPGLDLGGPSSNWGVREARAVVTWQIPGSGTPDAPDRLATYSSEYLMALTYDPTAEKWVIFDIRSAGLTR